MSNWQVCVDTILSPFGIVTVMPFGTLRTFFYGNVGMYVVKKMICCASVCNGALLCRMLRTVGTVRGSFSLPRLENVFTTTFFIS